MNYQNKSILIVGANGGLGKETTKFIVKYGFGHIAMAVRTEAKGQIAREEIIKETGSKNPDSIKVYGGFDMTDPVKLKQAIHFLPEDQKFDVVFLGAGGVFFTDDYPTTEWNGKKVEKTIFQNVIGAHITLSELKKKNKLSDSARIVFAGGEGARGIKGMIEKPDFKSSQELRDYVLADFSKSKPYNPMNAIGVSKLLGALWTSKLAEIEGDNLEAVWFTPGLTYGTNGLDGMGPLKRWFMANIGFGFMRLLGQAQSPVDGGRKFADALAGKYGTNGSILGAPEGKTIGRITDQTQMNSNFTNSALRDEFWAILEEVNGPFAA